MKWIKVGLALILILLACSIFYIIGNISLRLGIDILYINNPISTYNSILETILLGMINTSLLFVLVAVFMLFYMIGDAIIEKIIEEL